MAEAQETIADIIAWLRKPREGENAYLTLWRDEIADRLEAALKREAENIHRAMVILAGIEMESPEEPPRLWTALEDAYDALSDALGTDGCTTADEAEAKAIGRHFVVRPSGNAAKLHAAAEVTLTTIKKCMDILNSIPSDCGYGGLVEDVGDELCGLRDDFINAALKAPARNCDVLTADERTHKFIEKWEKAHGESIDDKTIIYLSSFSRWLQLPCGSEEAE